jgi:hypothetical protein
MSDDLDQPTNPDPDGENSGKPEKSEKPEEDKPDAARAPTPGGDLNLPDNFHFTFHHETWHIHYHAAPPTEVAKPGKKSWMVRIRDSEGFKLVQKWAERKFWILCGSSPFTGPWLHDHWTVIKEWIKHLFH